MRCPIYTHALHTHMCSHTHMGMYAQRRCLRLVVYTLAHSQVPLHTNTCWQTPLYNWLCTFAGIPHTHSHSYTPHPLFLTHSHTYTPTPTHASAHTHLYPHVCPYTFIHSHLMLTYTYSHVLAHTYTHTITATQTGTCSHTPIPTHWHTCSHTHFSTFEHFQYGREAPDVWQVYWKVTKEGHRTPGHQKAHSCDASAQGALHRLR